MYYASWLKCKISGFNYRSLFSCILQCGQHVTACWCSEWNEFLYRNYLLLKTLADTGRFEPNPQILPRLLQRTWKISFNLSTFFVSAANYKKSAKQIKTDDIPTGQKTIRFINWGLFTVKTKVQADSYSNVVQNGVITVRCQMCLIFGFYPFQILIFSFLLYFARANPSMTLVTQKHSSFKSVKLKNN